MQPLRADETTGDSFACGIRLGRNARQTLRWPTLRLCSSIGRGLRGRNCLVRIFHLEFRMCGWAGPFLRMRRRRQSANAWAGYTFVEWQPAATQANVGRSDFQNQTMPLAFALACN